MTGGSGNDALTGSNADNVLDGGAGIDTLVGAAGNDTLKGDDGNDILIGGAGNDTLDGGVGNDIFRYIALNDDVVAGQADTITAAAVGDRIDFSTSVEDFLKIGNQRLSALTVNTAVGSTFSADTNVRFNTGHLQIDLNGDQQFVSLQDFDVGLNGMSSVSYDAASDEFTFGAAAATKKIALTFDDGPDETYTQQVLNVLDTYGVEATFFEVGERVTADWFDGAGLAQTVANAGHLVENHTWNSSGFDHSQ